MKNVLIIEDDPAIQQGLSICLQEEHFQTTLSGMVKMVFNWQRKIIMI